jgi:hypothetical protein
MLKFDDFDLSLARRPLISTGENLNSTSTPDETGSLNIILDDTLSATLPELFSIETTSSISNQNSLLQQDMQPRLLAFLNSTQEDPFGLFQQQDSVSNSQCRILESGNLSSEQLDLYSVTQSKTKYRLFRLLHQWLIPTEIKSNYGKAQHSQPGSTSPYPSISTLKASDH